jgi:O-antigen/teichoic acid export membrane protein
MLRQKFLVQFGSQITFKIVGMVAGLIVARVAGPEVVGTIAFGTAYVSIWAFITGLFGSAHIKLISEGRDLGNCISTYLWLQGVSISVFFIMVVSVFLVQKNIFNYEFESETQQIVVIILLFAIVASKVLDIGNSTFTAKLEQAKANYPLFIRSIVWHIGRIVLVVIGFKAIGLVSWNLIITLLVIPIAWKYFKKLPRGDFSRDLAKRYLHYALPALLIVIIYSIIEHSGKLLLGHFTNTEELGYYAVAFSIGGMFLLISHTIGKIFFPYFSGLIADNHWEIVNNKIKVFHRFVVLFIFPLICTIFIVGEPFLLTILGEQYKASVTPFLVLLFATYIDVTGMPYGNVITGMGKFYWIVWINVILLIFYLLGILLFISPEYFDLGAKGLALNLLLVNGIKNILFLAFSVKFGNIVINIDTIIQHGVIVVPFIAFYILLKHLELFVGFSWVLIGFSALMLIYLILIAVRQIKIEDLNLLLDVVNIRKTVRYITNELNERDTKSK